MPIPDYPFTTDGCSGGMTWLWDILFKKEPPWNDLCVKHDAAYWAGGTAKQRWDADTTLMIEVAQRGYPIWAMLMWVGVRLGGHPLLPLPWRWSYGFKYPRCYER
jgi:hypothetical protein